MRPQDQYSWTLPPKANPEQVLDALRSYVFATALVWREAERNSLDPNVAEIHLKDLRAYCDEYEWYKDEYNRLKKEEGHEEGIQNKQRTTR